MQKIFQNIAKHIELNEAEKAIFESILHSKTLAKKELILEEGNWCHQINFVISGTLRAYHINREGKETTIMFAVADWWITDMYCFLNQKPAMTYIEALEKSEILQISKSDFDDLFIKIPKFEHFFRVLMQNAYTREQLRVMENLSLNAEERYHNFLNKYPQIVPHITLKQLASYLGITPEFLSILRKKK